MLLYWRNPPWKSNCVLTRNRPPRKAERVVERILLGRISWTDEDRRVTDEHLTARNDTVAVEVVVAEESASPIVRKSGYPWTCRMPALEMTGEVNRMSLLPVIDPLIVASQVKFVRSSIR